VAHRTGRQQELPSPKQARARPLREVFMLAAVRGDGDVLLERRPEAGVWGGLWCLPEFTTAAEATDYAQRALDGASARPVPLAPVEHPFTHFHLVITPLLAHCSGSVGAPDPARCLWYRTREPARLGLPAPIRLLLERLAGAAGCQAQLFD
jgi:A/G-specific adenine glycosylase